MSRTIQNWVKALQNYANRWWYTPLIALLAAADLFLIVVPTDGLLVSAAMLNPRRWLYIALMMTFGSTLGCIALAAVLQEHGLPFLLQIKPGLDQTAIWVWTNNLMDNWGQWAVFLVAASPLMQHPAVALAALAGMPLMQLFLLVLSGRALKFLFLSWVATHAPGMLGRLWGIQDDLKEVGLEDKDKGPSVGSKEAVSQAPPAPPL